MTIILRYKIAMFNFGAHGFRVNTSAPNLSIAIYHERKGQGPRSGFSSGGANANALA